ncbi:UNVERIFIED_CONTAM: putative spore protein YtfJ [Acetivibrio alkalicellulosi]
MANFNVNENINVLFERLEKFLTSKTVVGEPIQIGDATLIPFITTSFGLGSGSGSGKDEKGNDGTGGGSGIGARIAPTAILVIKKDNIELIPIKKSASMEKLVEMVPDIMLKLNLGSDKEKKKEEE